MELRILGPLEVADGEKTIALGGPKQRALLAILLLSAGDVVSTDRIVDELWGSEPPAKSAHTVQVYVSNLRKALGEHGRDLLVTRAPGYCVEVDAASFDLARFESDLRDGRAALEHGEAETASATLADALALWRGAPLADFAYEPFAQQAIARLEELRLVATELRIEAELGLGRHAELIPELRALAAAHSRRERPRAQLMLALYRSGRQAEALQVFHETRAELVEQLGIDPGPALQELERAILRQDESLDVCGGLGAPASSLVAPTPERSLLIAPEKDANFAALGALAEPLAGSHVPHELVLARLVDASGPGASAPLAEATASVNRLRQSLNGRGVAARAAAFTTTDRGSDVVRLATEHDVDLLLTDTMLDELERDAITRDLSAILHGAPCDVAVLVDRGQGRVVPGPGAPVLVPFGGAQHDWAALELGAWLASSTGVVLRLMGALEGAKEGRDASRLLAHAALAVQGLVGVATEPILVSPGESGLVEAAAGAGLLVVGLSESWQQEGLGGVRAAAARIVDAPMLLVRRGPRPGGLTAPENLTRYTWSLAGG